MNRRQLAEREANAQVHKKAQWQSKQRIKEDEAQRARIRALPGDTFGSIAKRTRRVKVENLATRKKIDRQRTTKAIALELEAQA